MGLFLLGDLDTRTCLHRFEDHAGPIRSLAVHPAGTHVLSAGEDRTLRVWNLTTLRAEEELPIGNDTINALWFSPAGQQLFTGGTRGGTVPGTVSRSVGSFNKLVK